MRLNGRLKVSVSTMPMRITTRRSVMVYRAVRADSQASMATRPRPRPAIASGPGSDSSTSTTLPPSAATVAARQTISTPK